MARRSSVRWQLPAMTLLSALSQVIGLVRAGVLARSFGASAQYDAYVLAGSVVSLGLVLVGSGVSAVLVPAFAQGREGRQVNSFITFLLAAGAATGVLLALTAPFVLRLVGAAPEVIAVAGGVVGLVLAAQYVATATSIMTAYLYAVESFTLPQTVNLCASLVQLGCVVMDPALTVIRLAVYVLACQTVVLSVTGFVAHRRGFLFRPRFSWRCDGTGSMIRLLVPTVCSTGAWKLSTLIDSSLAARVGIGAPTLLSYSLAVTGVIEGVLLGNVHAFAYSRMSKAVVTGGRREVMTRYALLGVALALLACAGFVVVGVPALRVLLGEKGFGDEGLRTVYVCALILLLAMPPGVVRGMLYNQFNADLDTLTPFRNSLVATVVNLVVSVTAAQVIGLYGVVLGSMVTAYFSMTTILLRTCRRYGLGWKDLVGSARRVAVLVVMAVLAAAVGWLVAEVCGGAGSVIEALCGGAAVVGAFGGSLAAVMYRLR